MFGCVHGLDSLRANMFAGHFRGDAAASTEQRGLFRHAIYGGYSRHYSLEKYRTILGHCRLTGRPPPPVEKNPHSQWSLAPGREPCPRTVVRIVRIVRVRCGPYPVISGD